MGKEATNESWLLESWTAKPGGSRSLLVTAVMQFNSCTVAYGLVFRQCLKKKGLTMFVHT